MMKTWNLALTSICNYRTKFTCLRFLIMYIICRPQYLPCRSRTVILKVIGLNVRYVICDCSRWRVWLHVIGRDGHLDQSHAITHATWFSLRPHLEMRRHVSNRLSSLKQSIKPANLHRLIYNYNDPICHHDKFTAVDSLFETTWP